MVDFNSVDWRKQAEAPIQEKSMMLSEDEKFLEEIQDFMERSGGIPPSYNDLRNEMQDAEGIERSSFIEKSEALTFQMNFLNATDGSEYAKSPHFIILEIFELTGALTRMTMFALHYSDGCSFRGEPQKNITQSALEAVTEILPKLYYLLYQLEYYYAEHLEGSAGWEWDYVIEIPGDCGVIPEVRSAERLKFSVMLLDDFVSHVHALVFGEGPAYGDASAPVPFTSDRTDTVRNARRVLGHLGSTLGINVLGAALLFSDQACARRRQLLDSLKARADEEQAERMAGSVANDVGQSAPEDYELVRDDLGDGMEFPEDGSELDLDDVP